MDDDFIGRFFMKFENTEVWGFEHAIRGMRNPLEIWGRSDSEFSMSVTGENIYIIGKNDLELMQKLIKAGVNFREFMDNIFVSVDITAPLYWWNEVYKKYKGAVANSTSTVHKLARRPITMDCFEMGDFAEEIVDVRSVTDIKKSSTISQIWGRLIDDLETLRCFYNATGDKRYWKELIRLLPSSWLQTRTITMSYENILTMVNQEKNHQLTEWSVDFMNWAKTLPYAEELLFI